MQSDDPDFETEGRGRDRPVRQSARSRGGLRRRRENRDSGPRPARSRAAAVARAGRSGTASSTYRHGTLSLFAALNTQSGEVLGQTVPRHTSAAFVDFLGDIVASQPKRREIHVIADNLSTHKTQAVRTFLLDHPNVQLHFTPDVFVVAQSSRTLVFEDRARSPGARHLYVRGRPGPQDSSLYPSLQQSPEADPLGLSQPSASNW